MSVTALTIGNLWLRIVEAKVIEVDVTPAVAPVVDDANEDLFADVRAQIDDHRVHLLVVGPACLEDDFVRVCANDFDARAIACTAANQKTGVRMRYRKRDGGERALRAIAADFVGADPILAHVAAGHVAATGSDGVALDRLALEGVAGGGPIGQVALFEIQIEHAAIGALAAIPSSGALLLAGLAGLDSRPAERSGSTVWLYRQRIGRLPSSRLPASAATFFAGAALNEDERALLVADDDIGPTVAVEIAGDDLRADAGIVVDAIGNELHLAAVCAPF